MAWSMTKQAACVMALVLAFAGGRVAALTVIPVTFEQLVEESTAVVYARVADVRGQWTADRQGIDSVVTLEALQYMKGTLGDTVMMRLPGGEAGGMTHVIPGAPTVREGELVVLFLKARGPALLSPVGFNQGVFRVVRDTASGRLLVTPPPLKQSAIGRVVRGAAERRALSVDALAATVRATAEGR